MHDYTKRDLDEVSWSDESESKLFFSYRSFKIMRDADFKELVINKISQGTCVRFNSLLNSLKGETSNQKVHLRE